MPRSTLRADTRSWEYVMTRLADEGHINKSHLFNYSAGGKLVKVLVVILL